MRGPRWQKVRSSSVKLSNQKRHWPGYLFGRIRTSTLVLIAAFLAVWWIYET